MKNVIYLVGDGMGQTHVTAARERFYGAAGELNMESLFSTGTVRTFAVEKNSGQPGEDDFSPNLVTDSASSATAWASGVKTYNAALGVDAKGAITPTVMELAKSAGYRTGTSPRPRSPTRHRPARSATPSRADARGRCIQPRPARTLRSPEPHPPPPMSG